MKEQPDDRWWKFRTSFSYRGGEKEVYPRSGFYADLSWLAAKHTENRGNYSRFFIHLREYQEIHPRWVIAFRQIVDYSAGGLPVYEKPFLGGPLTLRGHPAAHDAGDNLLLVSMESRHPLTRKYTLMSYGLYTFLDGGSVYDHSDGIDRAKFRWGTGVGAYLIILSYVLKLDVGWDFEENVEFTLTTGYHF